MGRAPSSLLQPIDPDVESDNARGIKMSLGGVVFLKAEALEHRPHLDVLRRDQAGHDGLAIPFPEAHADGGVEHRARDRCTLDALSLPFRGDRERRDVRTGHRSRHTGPLVPPGIVRGQRDYRVVIVDEEQNTSRVRTALERIGEGASNVLFHLIGVPNAGAAPERTKARRVIAAPLPESHGYASRGSGIGSGGKGGVPRGRVRRS